MSDKKNEDNSKEIKATAVEPSLKAKPTPKAVRGKKAGAPSKAALSKSRSKTISTKPAERKKSAELSRGIDPAMRGLLGVFVLAIGVAAVVAVGYLAYSRMGGAGRGMVGGSEGHTLAAMDTATLHRAGAGDSPQHLSLEEQHQHIAEQGDALAQGAVHGGEALPSQPDQNAVQKLSLDKAARSQMAGQWVARHGARTVYMSFDKDRSYEIVVLMDRSGHERRYGSGQYEYDETEGVVTLKASYEPLPEVEGADIRSLTRRVFRVVPLIDKRSGTLYWVAHNNQQRSVARHPVFSILERQNGTIEWTRAGR